jgi:hypothetical protein
MTEKTKVQSTKDIRTTRSPISNLIVGLVAAIAYFVLFNQSFVQALGYGLALFMLFNTIDYCILYYRMNKKEK